MRPIPRAGLVGLSIAVGIVLTALVVVFVERDENAAPRSERQAQQPGRGEANPPPAAEPARIFVTPLRRQRIEGWGISILGQHRVEPIAGGSGLSPAELARLDRLIFRDAGINLVRVFGPYQEGGAAGNARIGVWSRSDRRLELMRRVRRYGVRFMFAGAGAPLGLRTGNAPRRALAPGRERAYARFLARNLQVASEVGAPFQWAGIGNEPDNYGRYWVAMTPDQAAAVYRELARQIRSNNLGTRLVLGDNLGWGPTYSYARAALLEPAVRQLSSTIASHDYSGRDPATMRAVSDLARQNRLSVWMTEWGGELCPTGDCPDDPTIAYALRWARQIAYDLSVGNVQAWFGLQALASSIHGAPSGYAVRQYGNPARPYTLTKRYWVLRQFTSVAPPGAYRYVVRADSAALGTVAFRRGRSAGLVVTNPLPRPEAVRIGLGGGHGTLSIRRTSATEDYRPVGERRYSGRAFNDLLQPQSVTTFRLTSD